ncbi:hypothetical protein CY34DRAFT_810624 [Suillus luteus UH-Slu-Lm8-n1]|uniref:Uncharacterized protein n=1 Tax=Suillus luteus UH-Slu-Lm8-n1 TaxID=930992 RepID=A0A0C9ZIA5_9AGAM|nr:hypothetical protein CY34DRAFT_810624 [Suillus luteus UH-Slu-Lm8-n1]
MGKLRATDSRSIHNIRHSALHTGLKTQDSSNGSVYFGVKAPPAWHPHDLGEYPSHATSLFSSETGETTVYHNRKVPEPAAAPLLCRSL